MLGSVLAMLVVLLLCAPCPFEVGSGPSHQLLAGSGQRWRRVHCAPSLIRWGWWGKGGAKLLLSPLVAFWAGSRADLKADKISNSISIDMKTS